jgi:hypothetical protein
MVKSSLPKLNVIANTCIRMLTIYINGKEVEALEKKRTKNH